MAEQSQQPTPAPAERRGEVVAFPDRRAEIAAASRRPPLSRRGKAYVAVAMLCLVPSAIWLVHGLARQITMGDGASFLEFGLSAVMTIGLPVLLGWILLVLGLRQRVYTDQG